MSSGTAKKNPARDNGTKGINVGVTNHPQVSSSLPKVVGRNSSLKSSDKRVVTKKVPANELHQPLPQQQPSQTQSTCDDDAKSSYEKKVNYCDRLSSLLSENRDNSKSILRVNLLKKSSRQLNLSTLVGRRLQSAKPANTLKKSASDIIVPSSTTNTDVENTVKICPPSKNQPSPCKSSAGNEVIEDEINYTNSYKEAKQFQELLISFIRDVSKTVNKEDLDQMLKEINEAIVEVQEEHQLNRSNATETRSGKENVNRQRSDLKNNKVKATFDSFSDCSGKGLRDIEGQAENLDSSNGASQNQQVEREPSVLKLVKNKKDKNAPELNESNSDISISREQQKLCKQLMEYSSDEDETVLSGDTTQTMTNGKYRKPNSGRLPDRCLRITSSHAKYISPHRKRSLEERLSRAQEAREKFLEYRANKFRDILKKVEEMRAWKEEDTLNLKASVQTKLQKAAAKRKEQLDKIIRKAHDEDSKVSEIQFINNLEAQNRRHDMNSRKKDIEARLQDLQDERQRRFEEKQAKEVAAEERRKTLEAERKAKLVEIQQRRKLKTQKVEQQQQVKEKKRIERNRNREQKIEAIKEAYNAGVQTLRKRISQKQEQSERRHEVNLRLIRQKAFELSIKRYNSFISETQRVNSSNNLDSLGCGDSVKQTKDSGSTNDSNKRLQLKPFNTKKFCNLCKETISSESALFSHLRSESHLSSINDHYGNTMLTTNEAVEIHNLRHIVDTDEPLSENQSSSQQSSRASSLVNYYHSSHLSQANGAICMSESDRESLLAIEKKCRKLRNKLIVAGKPFNRDWFAGKIRSRLAELLQQQRLARNQSTSTELHSLANTIDLSANNVNCQRNKPFYLKISRITRELISLTTDQRISGGGLMPAGIVHSVDRLLADLNKQLASRRAPQLSVQLLNILSQQSDFAPGNSGKTASDSVAKNRNINKQPATDTSAELLDADQLAMATKMIESYAIDSLYLYDIVVCLVTILRRIVPNVSLTSKLPSTVASHYHSTLIDPISLNSYYCHRSPILPARIYIKMIGFLRQLCVDRADLCYVIFQSNNMINLSDILSYRLGFIIGNESPASSISGSSSAATLSAHTLAADTAANRTSAGSLKPRDNEPKEVNGHSNSNDTDDEEEEEDSLWERAETYKRTEDIVDDMTAGLCKLLATVTETILSKPLVLLDQIDRRAFDQRSDDFISYMVSVGIVDTESVIMSHIHQQKQQQQQQQLASGCSNPVAAHANLVVGSTSSSISGSGQQQTAQQQAPNAQQSTQQQTNSSSSGPQQQQTTGFTAAASSTMGTISHQSPATSLKIINFTNSCIQFVSSLLKLVIAKLPDEHSISQQPPKQQHDATQLLVTLKMTQLSGVLTLVYDMLVHGFNSLTETPAGQTVGSSQEEAQQSPATGSGAISEAPAKQLALALSALRLINYVAYIDTKLLHETLAADEMLSLQLRHVCSYLINYLVQSQFKIVEPTDAVAQGVECLSSPEVEHQQQQANGERLKNELMNEIILLLGNAAYLNPSNQLMLKSGRRPTIIEQLIGLPFDYFSRSSLKSVLMPTLISCAYSNDQICSIVCQELSLSMLTSFIEDQLLESQLESGKKQQEAKTGNVDCERDLHSKQLDQLISVKLAKNRWRFERRFAKSKWLSAKKYFESQQAKFRFQDPSS